MSSGNKRPYSEGDRVGAILSASNNSVTLLGYGTYQGEKIPSDEAGGFNFGIPNPEILLDNGDLVYGCECWWGAEGDIKNRVAQYENVVVVSIHDIRAEEEE